MKNTDHRFNNHECADVAALCARFTGRRLQSPTRSTVPLIDLIYNDRDAWKNLLIRLHAPTDVDVQFEAEVPSPKPGGNPSQTDAVFASETTVWAVEAKWTEPADSQTVAKRVSEPESDGADPHVTVSGWLTHLQRFSSSPLRLEDFMDVNYQMLHRAASAAYLGEQRKLKPELVYLRFTPSPDKRAAETKYYVSELTRLFERLGRPASLPMCVVAMPMEPTPAFEAIRHLDKHSAETSTKVREALCTHQLFEFADPGILRVR